MDQNPLTDPSSLICYRLANGESSLRARRPTCKAGGKAPKAPAIVSLGFALSLVVVLTLLVL